MIILRFPIDRFGQIDRFISVSQRSSLIRDFTVCYSICIFLRNTIRFGLFLAHLSRRLTGELIVYPWSGVRRRPSSVRPSSVVRRPSFTMLKHLLLRNRLADQSQILCGASLGRGNEILFAASGSHDQDGRHAHIW